MEPAAAKLIGAGIACIGMGGAGIGVGVIFGNYLAGALRNPAAAASRGNGRGRPLEADGRQSFSARSARRPSLRGTPPALDRAENHNENASTKSARHR